MSILSSFSALSSSSKKNAEPECDAESEVEGTSAQLVDSLISSLSPQQPSRVSRSRYLETVRNSLSSVLEAEKEGILTESEANALAMYIASKFVEHNVVEILQDIFETRSAETFSLRRLTERTE